MSRGLGLALLVALALAACAGGGGGSDAPMRLRGCDDGGAGGVIIDGVCL